MKEKMKKQNGIALVTLVLAIIITLVIVGVGALTIRMVVTGEEFLAPIEEFFGAEENDDKEEKDEEQKINNKAEEDEKTNSRDEEDDDKASNNRNDNDEFVHYHGELEFDDFTGGTSLEYSDLVEINIDLYASETEIDEMVFEFNLKEFLVNYYKEYESEMAASGFETYESFRDTMMETFETSFASGFATSGSEVDEFFEIKYPEEEIIEMSITKSGIKSLYENYSIEEGESIQPIIEGFETALGLKLEEV